ncbi:hypothetical protein, conserved [Trypanosoma brucei gambiense DAL972]|uniref:Choline transporter-like protein n=1 Tax=Trypanosoma brucei gambiense (strain MHOM/CI/86/DAL972) TaxID=679716 RepID=D0A393_TRYB9|nr:hypothetical protein, conserved [Trypanosoma brucei gambiense DAL972]CBH15737.1 hypothetical protein, conserved [Trypanosoma brucei gambiense DAL972]|eukprot:XP_011778001.1 hypothetical protein, conserved [Trypanosoma brucei gambiense DAL972]
MTQKGYVGVPEEPYRSKFTPEVGPYYGFEGEGTHAVPLQGIPLYQGEGNNQEGLKRFVVQGYKDVWAAILYILCILVTIGFGTYNTISQNFSDFISDSVVHLFWRCSDECCSVFLSVLFFVSSVSSVILSLFSLSLMKRFPHDMIITANLLFFAVCIVGFLLSILWGNLYLLLLCLGLFIVHWLCFTELRNRVPFAAELLKSSSTVVCNYKALCAVNAVLFGMFTLFLVLWCSAFSALSNVLSKQPDPSSGVSGKRGNSFLIISVFLLHLMLLFVMFWATQVTTNLMHVTTAGLTATWYFAGKENMPKNPTLASFKRGTTTSFGSICFGSLLVAIIRLIRWLVSTAEDSEHEILRCIFLCIIGCLESLMEYFNTYAFVHVAIYGCGYTEAAKMTWELCKRCSCAALFSCFFVDAMLCLFAVLSALLVCAVVCTAYGLVFDLSFGILHITAEIFVFSFGVCMLVHLFVFSSVTSAVTTLFVCYAEVPEGLEHSSPDLYAALQRTDQNGTSNGAAPPRV